MAGYIQPVVLVLIRKDDKFLLTLRAEENPGANNFHGFWQIPGGGLEFGESLEACAIREAKEELGIDITIIRMIPKIYHDVRASWHGLLIGFVCELKNPADEVVINEESSDYGWYNLEEAKQLKLMPLCIEYMEEVMKMSS